MASIADEGSSASNPNSGSSQRASNPRLSLTVPPPSGSPFPSPSSSFVPPPLPGAHEFAVKIPPGAKKNKRTSGSSSSMAASLSINPEEDEGQDVDSSAVGGVHSPNTPKPYNTTHASKGSTSSVIRPPSQNLQSSEGTTSPPQTPTAHDLSPFKPRNSSRDSTASVTSIASSRPAPPSPALSRRTSTRDPAPPSHRTSRLSQSLLALSFSKPSRPEIKVLDFAFPQGSPLRIGRGPHTPKANRRALVAHRDSQASAVSASSDEGGGMDDNDNGWGGFRAGLGRLSWGSWNSQQKAAKGAVDESDFARNFEAAADDSGAPADESEGESWDDGEYDDEETDLLTSEPETPLLPGTYRALYSFAAEGVTEMALSEGQEIKVIGRGGGQGWAIAIREEGEGHALVPEGYLELVRLDDGDDESGVEKKDGKN